MTDHATANRALRLLLGTLAVLVVAFALVVRATFRTDAPGPDLTLNRLYRLAAGGQVVSATLRDQDAQVVGRYCPRGPVSLSPDGVPLASSCAGGVKPFHADYPRSDVVTQSLVDRLGARATVAVDRQTAKQVGRLLVTFVLPLLLLANLFALIFAARGGEGSMAEVAGFGRFQRRRQRERAAERTVTFADVAGAEHGHRCGRTADVDGERAPCGGGVDRPDGSPSRHYLTSSRRRGRAHGIASPLDAHAAASGCEDGEAST